MSETKYAYSIIPIARSLRQAEVLLLTIMKQKYNLKIPCHNQVGIINMKIGSNKYLKEGFIQVGKSKIKLISMLY